MKIRTFYRLENGIYRVSVHTEEWSENDIRLMEKFGEPEINVGGDLEYTPSGASEAVSWHIDDSYRRLKSEPISMSFDSRDSVHAEAFANLWADRIVSDVSAAYSALHSHVDGFTRETVHTLSAD